MPKFEYFAVKYMQADGSTPIYLLAARCDQILEWAGIPRKEAKEGVRTVGYQRMGESRRIEQLENFLDDSKNIIANPILCAIRNSQRVSFSPTKTISPYVEMGSITIEEPDYSSVKLLDLLRDTEKLLLARLPRLATDITVTSDEISEFCRTAEEIENEQTEVTESESDDDEQTEEQNALSFSSESHIEDFYRAVKLRLQAIERIPSFKGTKLAGFTREMLIDYLRTATVVDGQHRLLGAKMHLDESLETEDARSFQETLLNQGVPKEEVLQRAKENYGRWLGVSLIGSDNWAEHVFQFVVVNQKAKPINRALLGSIIATTLTDNEVTSITERLSRANIEVADYRIIAYLERSPDSPFIGLIKQGYAEGGDSDQKLDWSAVDKLASMFRHLRGGKLFHEKNNLDHARNWQPYMVQSEIVSKYRELGYESEYHYWSSEKGPWLDVFTVFWTIVRNKLSDVTDDTSRNYWGSPKTSNLFNHVHLTILAADFFEYLSSGRGITIRSKDDAILIVEEYLGDAKKEYFARDWFITGKKTDKSVMQRWSEKWNEYRKSRYSRLPKANTMSP